MPYIRFAAMIATSTIVMFGLMYLNTYALDHVAYSQTRTWMALVMGATMSIIMLGFMWSMYKNRRANAVILAGSVIVFAGALWLVRSQETVYDVSYMKAMIPHHSIAILTSERAHIRDPRVRQLADKIIEAQVREIDEMKRLIADIEANPLPDDAPDLPSYRKRGEPSAS
jgi:Na+/proline symporter